ncbi:GDP-L-fucose synthase [Nitrosospira briensis]|uniref:GDP-L-fucose synthase n=1 Tax=Nitrosospira briensis TaxID=35799 RepID=A0A1I5BNF9_9PROT|nr:GDP-L-fucose synthase [Nitrosospira briensis]SFN76021.1 GDP-L-fucose synthase [Nitrosospira briensis]
MDKDDKIYVAGHRGLVGSAIVLNLEQKGYRNLLVRTHAELDLTRQEAVEAFFADEKPDHVFLAAAKAGGIYANNTYPAEFIRDNLMIQTNIIHEAYRNNVRRLLYLGSSCIYPKFAPQPIKEEYLLNGPLEPTNRPYALAKIAGIEMCWSYNRQYGTQYLAVMPANLYGPGDSYDLNNSHVIPALIRKVHEAKVDGATTVTVWGSGTPRREFLYSDDLADACVFLMSLRDDEYAKLLGRSGTRVESGAPGFAPLLNIGAGVDVAIGELAEMIKQVAGYTGEIVFDTSKPDGTPRKLMDSSRINAMGWKRRIMLREGLCRVYSNFIGHCNYKKPVFELEDANSGVTNEHT